MKKLLRILASGVLGLSMTTGVVLAADTSVDHTGPDSKVEVEVENEFKYEARNNNNLDLRNSTRQDAHTGDAKVYRNTTGEDATTGSADNDNFTGADVSIDNSNGDCACVGGGNGGDYSTDVSHTGPDSKVEVEYENEVKIEVENNNTVNLNNSTTQNATSGDAKVSRNTTGGGASTGDASNINTSEFVINISN